MDPANNQRSKKKKNKSENNEGLLADASYTAAQVGTM